MNIVIISTLFSMDHGGSEELWMKLAAEANSDGHNVVAFVYEKKLIHPKLQRIIDLGIKVIYRKHQSIPDSITGKVAYHFKRKLLKFNPYKQIDAFNPDVIYINQAGSIDAVIDGYLREYLYKTAVQYYINPHQVSELQPFVVDNNLKPHVQRIFNKASGLIFVSNRNKEVLYKNWEISNSNFYITQNPMNVTSFEPVKATPLNGVVRLATVAALLFEQKGHDLLLQVLNSSKWRSRNWQWNIYGSGPDQEKLQLMIKEFALSDRVFLKGFTNDVRKIWEENDAHVFPTLSEGMPLAIIESLICGRPVIATDIGGITDWVKEGENGFIAEKPTVAAIDEALERAWAERYQWLNMQNKINQKVMSQYNLNYAADLLRFITNQQINSDNQ